MRSVVRNGFLLGLTLCGAGCTTAGTIMHVVFGPPAVDAQYEPQKRPTLVLVEDYQDQDASAVDGDSVARSLGAALHDHIDLEVIDPDKVAALRTDHAADFREMAIPAVGRMAGAQQVVYVNLVENQTSADPTGMAIHATATARVRVVDVDTGKVLWPAGQPKGKELSAKMEYDQADSSQGPRMRSRLLGELSDQIAKLFYKWKPDTEQESNEAG